MRNRRIGCGCRVVFSCAGPTYPAEDVIGVEARLGCIPQSGCHENGNGMRGNTTVHRLRIRTDNWAIKNSSKSSLGSPLRDRLLGPDRYWVSGIRKAGRFGIPIRLICLGIRDGIRNRLHSITIVQRYPLELKE